MPDEPMVQDTSGKTSEGSESFDRKYVEELRGEAASYRTKLRDAEKRVEDLAGKLQTYDDSKKSEVERLTEEKARLEKALTERERKLVETTMASSIKTEAGQMGIIDPAAAYALIDMAMVEYDDGNVKGVKKALEKLIKDKPYLIERSESETPPTPGAGGQPIAGGSQDNLDKAIYNMLKGGKR